MKLFQLWWFDGVSIFLIKYLTVDVIELCYGELFNVFLIHHRLQAISVASAYSKHAEDMLTCWEEEERKRASDDPINHVSAPREHNAVCFDAWVALPVEE